MKKYLAILCATMLCVCCLALAACGGGASSSAAASSAAASSSTTASSASAASSSAAADPATEIVGDWKLAAAESQGITMVGDFSSILGVEASMNFTVNADGTAKMSYGEESVDLTWKIDGKNITFSSADATIPATFEDGAIIMTSNDESFVGQFIFTKDGTYDKASVISSENATPITSADGLVGTWSLSAMNMMGISMYGEASSLAALTGESADTTLVFNADGTASFMGTSMSYTVDGNGLSLGDNQGSIEIKKLDDDLVLDMSSMLGMPLVMVFSK